MRDYYKILEVRNDASFEVIDAAYRSLSRKYHPDINLTPDAVGQMKLINEAYEILRNPTKRTAYDSAWAAKSYKNRQVESGQTNEDHQASKPPSSGGVVWPSTIPERRSKPIVGGTLVLSLTLVVLLFPVLGRIGWLLSTIGFAIIPTPIGPFVLAPYASPTAVPTSTPVPTATETSVPVPTSTATSAPVPTLTQTSTIVPTATQRPAPTATPAAPAVAVSECSPSIDSQIAGFYSGWTQSTVFPLANGQTWQQSDNSGPYHLVYFESPKVSIYAVSGQCILQVTGDNAIVRVKRLR
ncbi:MAG: DnaJ domain-containing protein [Chloroflexi bacterium]|nr:DnaJ domain-containing protein [Chloroflexota bacterium]